MPKKISKAQVPATVPGQTASVPSTFGQTMRNGGSFGGWPQMFAGMTFEEIGASGLRQFSGWVREEYQQELIGRQGARTYREMQDGSATVGGIMYAIRATMRKVEWRVVPSADTPDAQEKAEFVESLMDDMTHTWDDFVDEMLSMMTYGYSPHEIVYKRRNGFKPGPDPKRPGHDLPKSKFDDNLIGWRRIPLRGQDTVLKWFFDENGVPKGVTQQPYTGALIDLPIEKMLLFRTSAHKNNPEGRSLLRNAYRAWFFSKRVEEQEAILFERLNGVPVIRVPPSLIEQAKAGNADAVAQMSYFKQMATNIRINEQMGIVLPSIPWEGTNGTMSNLLQYDMTLVTPEATRSAVKSNEVILRYNTDMMTTVMADFLSLGHSARGTQALATSKVDMFFQAIEGFLNSSASVIDRYAVSRVWDLNGFDEDLMPKIEPDLAQRIDLDVLSNFVMRLSQSGMPLFPNEDLSSYLLDAAGLPDLVDPMALAAAGMSEEIIDAKTEQMINPPPPPPAVPGKAGTPTTGAQPGGENAKPPSNLEKMIKASLARRVLKMQGPSFGITTRKHTARKRNKYNVIARDKIIEQDAPINLSDDDGDE